MDHHFNIEVAKEHGVDVAIFLHNIAFWTLKNVANKSHLKDGRYWIYNTQEAWTILFPYWSRQNIRTIINKCIEKDLIITGNYNEKNYDKTTWYSLSDKCLFMFPTLKAAIEVKTLGWNQPRVVDNFEKPWLESTNGLVGINQPIPDNKPDNKHKSFCNDQKKTTLIPTRQSAGTPPTNMSVPQKTKTDWRQENSKVHEFAESKNQMANEARHIEQHEEIKRTPMPESLRSLIKNIKYY